MRSAAARARTTVRVGLVIGLGGVGREGRVDWVGRVGRVGRGGWAPILGPRPIMMTVRALRLLPYVADGRSAGARRVEDASATEAGPTGTLRFHVGVTLPRFHAGAMSRTCGSDVVEWPAAPLPSETAMSTAAIAAATSATSAERRDAGTTDSRIRDELRGEHGGLLLRVCWCGIHGPTCNGQSPTRSQRRPRRLTRTECVL